MTSSGLDFDQAALQALMSRHQEEILYLQVEPAQIDLFNKVMEAYDNVALVTTVDPKVGKIALWTTPNTLPQALKIIKKMPCKVLLWEDFIKE